MSAADKIITSASDDRTYRHVALENGLNVLLIHDPSCDKAAAAMDVHVGSYSDPRDLPGLAHFLGTCASCDYPLLSRSRAHAVPGDRKIPAGERVLPVSD